MKFFNKLSIKNKLIAIIFTTSLFIIITGFSFVIYTNVDTLKSSMIEEMELISTVTATNSQTYLSFKNSFDADEALEFLKGIEEIKFAVLFDESNIVYTKYDSENKNLIPPRVKQESSYFEDGYLHIYKTIVDDNQKFGTLYLRVSTEALNAKINQFLIVMFVLTLVLSGISFFTAVKLQTVISEPIIKLADTAQSISKEGDYSTRVKTNRDDEIGYLYDGFNSMLNQIESQIMERDRVEKALRESEHRLQTITAISPVGIFRSNVDGELIWGNQKSLELRDLSLVEAAGRGWEKTVHPDDIDRVETEWYNAVNAHRPFISEYRFMHKNKDVVWVLAQSVAEYDSEGNVQGFVGTITDITERKIVEKALLDSEQYNRMLFNLSPIGFVLSKFDANILDINLAFAKIINSEYADIVHKSLYEFTPNNFEKTFNKIKNLKVDERFGPERIEIFDFKKRSHNALLSAKIIEQQEEKIIWLSIEDITERIKLERDKESLEIKLRQQQKLESIGTLASGVAHEINNPLMGIINYATLINKRIENDSLKEFSKGIIFEGERVAKIVKNLLSFARQEKETHQFEKIDIIIDNALSLIKASLRKDKINLSVEVESNLPEIKCNGTQIEQVLINLLTNARDALNEHYGDDENESKNITLKAERINASEQNYIKISVTDNASGIDPEVSLRVFDPFYTTKPREKGTGLGLSISYGIVQDHKSELKVDTKLGEYSSFHFNLLIDNNHSS